MIEKKQENDKQILYEFLQHLKIFQKEDRTTSETNYIVHKEQLRDKLKFNARLEKHSIAQLDETTNYPIQVQSKTKSPLKVKKHLSQNNSIMFQSMTTVRNFPIMIQTNVNEIPPLFLTQPDVIPEQILHNVNTIVSSTTRHDIHLYANKLRDTNKKYNVRLYNRNPKVHINPVNNFYLQPKLGQVPNINNKDPNINSKLTLNEIKKYHKAKNRVEKSYMGYENMEMNKINKLFNTFQQNTSPKHDYYKHTAKSFSNDHNYDNNLKYKYKKIHSYPNEDEYNIDFSQQKQLFQGSKEQIQQMMNTLDKEIEFYSKVSVGKKNRVPLRSIKKSTHHSYDDTPFQTFLKTQEKLNEVLDKLLTRKSSKNHISSVETI